jgi:two-component system chemotaxis response regulator CheB
VLPVEHAVDGEVPVAGRIYIAPPDRHLIVEEGRVRVTYGPKEHHTRPAIDPLFMSAALALGNAVAGVILTGTMEDGTAGLQAIKACGGIAIVQDPAEAIAPEMPATAMRYVLVDHCLPVGGMGSLLMDWVQRPLAETRPPVPMRVFHEMQLHTGEGDAVQHLEAIAEPSPFVCPDCKGVCGRSTGQSRCDTAATPAMVSHWRRCSRL